MSNDNELPVRPELFTDSHLNDLISHFIGNTYRYRENIIVPRGMGPVTIKTNEEKMVEGAFESCAFKTAMSCVLGFGLGAAIGLFSSSVSPMTIPGQDVQQQTAREILKEMKKTTLSYAKNFAMVGTIFSAVECTIESGTASFMRTIFGFRALSSNCLCWPATRNSITPAQEVVA